MSMWASASARTASARRSVPAVDRHGDAAGRGVDARRLAAEWRQQLGDGPQVVGATDPDLDDVPTGTALQLGRRAGGDRPAVVDDHHLVGQLVGLVEVLRRQQHVGAGPRRAPGWRPTARCGCAGRGRSSARRAAAAAARRRGWRRGRAGGACRPSSRARAGRRRRSARSGRARSSAAARGAAAVVAEQAGDHDQVLATGQRRLDGRRLPGQPDRPAHPLGMCGGVDAGHAQRRRRRAAAAWRRPARTSSCRLRWVRARRSRRRPGRRGRGRRGPRRSPNVLRRPVASIVSDEVMDLRMPPEVVT